MYLKGVVHVKFSAKVCTMYVSVSVCSSGSRFLVYTVGSKGAKLSPLCLPVATPLNTYTSVAQPERIPCAVAQNFNTYGQLEVYIQHFLYLYSWAKTLVWGSYM